MTQQPTITFRSFNFNIKIDEQVISKLHSIKSISDISDIVLSSTPQFGIVDEFKDSVSFVSILSNAWDTLKCADAPPQHVSLKVSPLQLAEIFAGNYSLIPNDEKETEISDSTKTLIVNDQLFNSLSSHRQKQIAHFLSQNYTNLLLQTKNAVFKISTGFNQFNQSSKNNLLLENSVVAGFNDIKLVKTKLQSAQNVVDGMNVLVHDYIPVLMKHKKLINFDIDYSNASYPLSVFQYI